MMRFSYSGHGSTAPLVRRLSLTSRAAISPLRYEGSALAVISVASMSVITRSMTFSSSRTLPGQR